MSTALTFENKDVLASPIVDAANTVHYMTTTTRGFVRRKITTVMAASNLVGLIDWREKTFTINGVQRKWEDMKTRSGGVFSSEREWSWTPDRPFKFKYNHSQTELLATPTSGDVSSAVRFTVRKEHLFHAPKPAVIQFPPDLRDETERMYLLLVILKTETQRQEVETAVVVSAATT
ncbi:hypothetical protein DFH09DRAFT_1124094 [Mycena vulgaris]|nr:hypothetical protein DFH09DRAFT_1124094 [Mycena vulgaris]